MICGLGSVEVHQKCGLGADNVHYNETGYKELSKQIIKCLEEEITDVKQQYNSIDKGWFEDIGRAIAISSTLQALNGNVSFF